MHIVLPNNPNKLLVHKSYYPVNIDYTDCLIAAVQSDVLPSYLNEIVVEIFDNYPDYHDYPDSITYLII